MIQAALELQTDISACAPGVSAPEPVRVLPLRAPSPAAAANGAAGGGGGGPTTGTGRGGFLAPMPQAAPMTEREKELQAKAELRRARR